MRCSPSSPAHCRQNCCRCSWNQSFAPHRSQGSRLPSASITKVASAGDVGGGLRGCRPSRSHVVGTWGRRPSAHAPWCTTIANMRRLTTVAGERSAVLRLAGSYVGRAEKTHGRQATACRFPVSPPAPACALRANCRNEETLGCASSAGTLFGPLRCDPARAARCPSPPGARPRSRETNDRAIASR